MKGQLVYEDNAGIRMRVRAAMSLSSGRIFVYPSSEEVGIPAARWEKNPDGDGEFQVSGFGAFCICNGTLRDVSHQQLAAITKELRRLNLVRRLVYQ